MGWRQALSYHGGTELDFTFDFISVVMLASLAMMVWACIEVGSNDATNLVNAVFGARVLKRKTAVLIAGVFVVLGATFASPVMDTVRKGIFNASMFDAAGVASVFITSYLVNTVLLYAYSAYGLPISTTATLVFSLAGGAIGVSGNPAVVAWPMMGRVVSAIFVSIFLSGMSAFLVQRMFRGAIRKDAQNHELVLLHGPWMTGMILASLGWFMIVKGMSGFPMIQELGLERMGELGAGGLLLSLWGFFTLLTHLFLVLAGRRGTLYLFHGTSVLGMICMAVAFGQNDLANCASPGLAVWLIWREGVGDAGRISIPLWTLFGCGFLMFLGMRTQRAQRVTRAEINTASQQSKVRLYAPVWCVRLAGLLLRAQHPAVSGAPRSTSEVSDVAPEPTRNEEGKKFHYDPLRASVILAVSACVIAFASGLGLPVSTTYVSFAAVIATGWGDRIFSRGRSDLKLGRALWVVVSWLMGAVLSALASFLLAFMISRLTWIGLALAFILNFTLRYFFRKRADRHEITHHLMRANKKNV
ncbi:MAG: inorganic phosphate transporter [Deltaproteobacteria bacterium]|nr:inorganic phosphate transporter [Deltaproteobacteria bacterium]